MLHSRKKGLPRTRQIVPGELGGSPDQRVDDSGSAYPRFLRLGQASARWSVSGSYLRNSECPKIFLPGNGAGKKCLVLFDVAEVEAWFQQHAVRATTAQRRSA